MEDGRKIGSVKDVICTNETNHRATTVSSAESCLKSDSPPCAPDQVVNNAKTGSGDTGSPHSQGMKKKTFTKVYFYNISVILPLMHVDLVFVY